MAIDWKEVSARVARYAGAALGKRANRADVEETCAEAVARALAGRPYANQREATEAALHHVRTLARDRRRRRQKDREVLWPDVSEAIPIPPPDLAAALDNAAMMSKLREALAGDPGARALLDAFLDGAVTRELLARRLGRSTAEIHNVSRRVYRRARRLFARERSA